MLFEIIAMFSFGGILFALVAVAGATGIIGATRTVATTAAPIVTTATVTKKDQRPLWAQVPMAELVPPRCSAWENEQARQASRFDREAQAGKDRPLPRFTPTPEPPPQRRWHRPLKAKSRNWA